MQDVEDQLAHCPLARHALESHFPVAVPGLHAVLAINDVQAERQRVDDAGGEAPLRLNLAGRAGHFSGQAVHVLGVRQLGSEQVGNDGEHVARVSGYGVGATDGQDPDALSHRDQPRAITPLGSSFRRRPPSTDVVDSQERRARNRRSAQGAAAGIQPEAHFGRVECVLQPLNDVANGRDDLAALGES